MSTAALDRDDLALAATPAAAPAPIAPRAGVVRRRVDAVDALRGLVMVLMALDHTRDYFGDAAADPTNLRTAGAALFLTRWVTHFCAPVFFLLTGAGAALTLGRRTPAGLSRFLLTRGLWLVVLELTVLRTLLQFNVDYRVTILNVLWALGWSLAALSVLSRLPLRAVVAVGVGLIALHNLADPVAPAAFGAWAPLWIVLHQPGLLYASGGRFVLLAYPLVPWVGVTAVGFGLGRALTWPPGRRRALLLCLGLGVTAAFVLVRALNVYGDPRPWATQPTVLRTALSFLNTTKYPPSLLFLLMTLGPALLALRWLDGRLDAGRPLPAPLRPALVFGRVPLFYFLLHFALIHLLAVLVSAVRFGTVRGMFESPTLDRYPVTQPPGWPVALPWVYLAWAAVVVLAYPCCRWYGALKARRAAGWMSYL
ncbi:hypothetical protein tb265_42740 [Gemmatimonadetes bacterium T265]|nr:hypothetical protein tb265_42740 [Gemmatimonadetes bacterium T265]